RRPALRGASRPSKSIDHRMNPPVKPVTGRSLRTKGSSGINSSILAIVRRDGVVPFAVEFGASDSDGVHFVIRDDDAFWILVGVEFAVDREAGARCRGGDQVDDHAIADQRCGAPVLTDEREQAVLDLVPLAGAWRKVADGDVDAELVGQALELALPQPQARTVAAAAISGDHELFGLRIAKAADVLPPATDSLHGKGCRVVIHPDADPSVVRGEVIDAVGHRSAQLLDQEVVAPHRFRLALRPPLPAAIL